MAVLPIRDFPDPVLRQRAAEVEQIGDVHRRLVRDMIDTMREAPGVGLAGPQVGVLERIFVWEVEDEYGAVFNPEIVVRSAEKVTDAEGCLSLPGLTYDVERHLEVTVRGLDEHGNDIEIIGEDLLARVFQHEIDHLDGVLFIDHLSEEDRKEALATLRNRALGLPEPAPRQTQEERL